jgi:hypothetical protein
MLMPFLQVNRLPSSPEQLLAQIDDIQIPEAVGFWPPSVALLAVLVALISTIFFCIYVLVKRWLSNAYRRKALQTLMVIDAQNPNAISEQCKLLKQVLYTAVPTSRSVVAKIFGADLYHFITNCLLSETSRFDENHFNAWHSYAYTSTNTNPESANELRLFCSEFIRRHTKKNISIALNNHSLSDNSSDNSSGSNSSHGTTSNDQQSSSASINHVSNGDAVNV